MLSHTLQKLTGLGDETFPYLLYFPELSATYPHFFTSSQILFYAKKTFCYREEIAFKGLGASKPWQFCRTDINNRCQKCVDFQGSYSDTLKHYLNLLSINYLVLLFVVFWGVRGSLGYTSSFLTLARTPTSKEKGRLLSDTSLLKSCK